MVEMEKQIENLLPEEDYYKFLNVPRTASLDEITIAFRRFSLIFHPDKHNISINRRMWSETFFNKMKEAYEVLSDPHKRAIYNTLGKKGLEVDGWEVIRRTQTPNEIRKEYERLLEMRQEADAMVELMAETYMRIKSEEKNKKGLIIVRGLYGKLPEGATNHESHEEQHGDSPSSELVDLDTEVIDVTIPLQCLVNDSRLELVAGIKAGLPAFFNPCMSQDWHLTVYYSFRGFPHCCTVADNQAVVLPCAGHRCICEPRKR